MGADDLTIVLAAARSEDSRHADDGRWAPSRDASISGIGLGVARLSVRLIGTGHRGAAIICAERGRRGRASREVNPSDHDCAGR